MADPYQWATPDVLVEKGYPADVAERAVFSASWLLWALSGRTLHAEGNRVDTWELKPGGRALLKLRYRPVLEVTTLESYSPWDPATTTAITQFAVVGNTVYLRQLPSAYPLVAVPALPGSGPWATPANVGPMDGTGATSLITATYVVGSNLPPQTHLTVLALAEEYCKAAVGKGCNLPQRVTSITRSGMTWALLDPADFLDKGLTGVIPIDSWVTAVNPKHTKQPARLYDPSLPKLISSTWAHVPTSSVSNNDGTVTYFGHGSPSIITIDDAESGDSYVDLDTGKTYGAT